MPLAYQYVAPYKMEEEEELLYFTMVKKRGMPLVYPYVAPYKWRRRRSSSASLW